MLKKIIKQLGGAARWLDKRIDLIILLALMALLLTGNGPPPGEKTTGIARVVANVQFGFWAWEGEAVWAKFTHWLVQPQRYMNESDRCALTRNYVARLGQIGDLQGQIAAIYADPQTADPVEATAPLRERLAEMQAQAARRQLTAEAIMEEQVGVILSQAGLGFSAHPFPPIGIHFTPLPYVLIVSPRDKIETLYQQDLEHGLNSAQQAAIEEEIDRRFDVSSLVTEIGGMSAWPAMVLEDYDLAWLLDVTAHEWTHHYLSMHPLGWEYEGNQETRTINETTSSIVGTEAGRAVLARYYPDLLPPPEPPEPPVEEGGEESPPPEPPEFDYRAEMHDTRVEVDRLLEEGKIEEAEQYMDAQRLVFWENGYHIRKLNQAYFAFHGSYAEMMGAAGEDPIGPAVQQLRAESKNLHAFLATVGRITTLAELQETLARME